MLTMSTGSLSLDELAQKLGKTEDLFSGKAATSVFPSRWKSLSSGTIKVVRIDGDYVYVETLFPEDQQPPRFNAAELKKTGDKYVGTTRSGGPCSYVGFTPFVGMNEKGNNCSFQFAIEITALNPTRI